MSNRMTQGCRARGVVLGAMLLLAAAPALSGNTAASAPCIPALTLQLEAPHYLSNLSRSSDGVVQCNGTVKADKLPVERVVVRLSYSFDQPWWVSLAPQSLVITDTNEHPFRVTVNISRCTEFPQAGLLVVEGVALAEGYVELHASSSVAIKTNPYYCLTLDTPKPFVGNEAGKRTRLELRLTNLGNAVDSCELSISNRRELDGLKWTVNMPDRPSLSHVGPGSSVRLNLTVNIPPDPFARGATHAVNITVRSLNASALGIDAQNTLLLHLHVRPGLVGIEPLALVIVYCVLVAGLAVVLRRRRRGRNADERPPAEAGGLHPIGAAWLPPPKGGGLLSDEEEAGGQTN